MKSKILLFLLISNISYNIKPTNINHSDAGTELVKVLRGALSIGATVLLLDKVCTQKKVKSFIEKISEPTFWRRNDIDMVTFFTRAAIGLSALVCVYNLLS